MLKIIFLQVVMEQALRAAFEPAEGVAKDSLLAEARGRLSPPRIPDFVMIPLPQRFSFHSFIENV